MSTAQLDADLEEEIFGGELSEVESSDDEQPAQRQVARPVYDPEEHATSSEDEEAGSGDDYRQAARPIDGALPTFKKVKRVRDEGEEAARPKKQRKKRARRVSEDEAEQEAPLDPEEAKRRALEQRLDAILKKPKPKKRKRTAGEEDLGAAEEEECIKLRQDMNNAYMLDRDENANGRPAVHKLQMLSRVVETMQKSHLEVVALDNGILGAIKDWLKPLDDKSLPSLTIQRALFAILIGLQNQIDNSTLKDSEVGRVVLFYSKCARVDPAIKRIADQLITAWLRPLMRRSATWRDRPVEKAETPASPMRRRQLPAYTNDAATVHMPSMVYNAAAEARRANIPQAISTAYEIAPRSQFKNSAQYDRSHAGASLDRFKAFSSKLKSTRKRAGG